MSDIPEKASEIALELKKKTLRFFSVSKDKSKQGLQNLSEHSRNHPEKVISFMILFIAILLMVSVASLPDQEEEQQKLLLSGQLEKTGGIQSQPVPDQTISVGSSCSNTSWSTTTKEQGYFDIELPENQSEETLVFCVGGVESDSFVPDRIVPENYTTLKLGLQSQITLFSAQYM